MLLHISEMPKDVAALFSRGRDVYADRHDFVPALYGLLANGQVRKYRRELGLEERRRTDLAASLFHDVSYDGPGQDAQPSQNLRRANRDQPHNGCMTRRKQGSAVSAFGGLVALALVGSCTGGVEARQVPDQPQSLAPATAGAKAPEALEPLVGSYRFAGGAAEEKAVAEAIEDVVSEVNPLIRASYASV